jgi:long-subunit fatty acid transport protein
MTLPLFDRRPDGRRLRLTAPLASAVGLLCLPIAAGAQDVILPELPFTTKHGVSARAAGLGYAYGAVAEDGSALWFNPAGLAQVRKMELSGGLVHDSQDRTTGFDTQTNGFEGTGFASRSTELSDTAPTQLTFAYPFPTYRGSLVLGVGYQRLVPLATDYLRRGEIVAREGQTPGLREIESYLEDGSIDFWTVGLGGDLSPRISVGGTLSYLAGSTHQEFEIGRVRTLPNGTTDVNASEEVFLSSDTRDADLSGWTFSVGVLGRVSDSARLGLTVNGPEQYEFDGAAITRLEDQEKIDRTDFLFTDEVTLPVSLLASAALTPSNFLITGDLRWTDWTQVDFEGPIRNEDRQYAYRSTVDVSMGAEYQFSGVPARVRAGFSIQPVPYDLVPTDVDFTFVPDDGNNNTTDDVSYFTRNYEEARFDSGRKFFSVGAGTLIEDALALDVAYVHGMFERSSPDGRWTEEWTSNRIYGTATFRF